ncbi:MAG TPA: pantoate--beta-alanine ligase, partial [Bacteroidales bacterium]|nr:pantoate--beta-alanine ligase [Bacteroidales bacterium]
MNTYTTIAGLKSALQQQRASGLTIGFVPTMGALHEGHLSLVRASQAEGGFTVVTIFVNPTQFAPGEDLDKYPRTMDADLEMCQRLGVNTVYMPTSDDVYVR